MSIYKPHGFFLGFLATYICFCVTVLFYRYLYFVVKVKVKARKYYFTSVTRDGAAILLGHPSYAKIQPFTLERQYFYLSLI